jgi:hypothetical protein
MSDIDDIVNAFLARAASSWGIFGDLTERSSHTANAEHQPAPPPWTDPDHPDPSSHAASPVLDAAYRSGVVPKVERWQSDFIMPIGPATPLAAALAYARRGWPVFPGHWQGERRKHPLIAGWQAKATTAEAQIIAWWTRWPAALIGVPTGKASGLVVLDIDTKNPAANGYDTLKALGKADLPATPRAHTASGGEHVYFATIGIEIRNSIGQHGLGPGLDVRGEGGLVITPSPGSGYRWDPIRNFDTCSPIPAPAWLGHREKAAGSTARRRKVGERFNATDYLVACGNNIRNASAGDKYRTVRSEAFKIGTLVRDKLVTRSAADHELKGALKDLEKHTADPGHMWDSAEDAFAEGLAAPGRRAAA